MFQSETHREAIDYCQMQRQTLVVHVYLDLTAGGFPINEIAFNRSRIVATRAD